MIQRPAIRKRAPTDLPSWLVRAERLLIEANRTVRLLGSVVPRNAQQERARLVAAFEAGQPSLPRWSYARTDHTMLRKTLASAAQRLGAEPHPIAQLYAARARELEVEAALATEAGTTVLGALARARFRSLSPAAAALRDTPDAFSFVRAEGGARATAPLGPVEGSLLLRGVVDASRMGRDAGDDRAGAVRGRFAVPLAKQLESGMVHVIEPFVEGAVVHTRGDGLFGLGPARGGSAVLGTAPIADAGVTTSLGRWNTRDALELMAAGGTAFNARETASTVRPLARARLALSTGSLGASVDGAYVFGGESDRQGGTVATRARIGPRDGIRLLANVAARDGIDPVLARTLVDAPLEPASGFLVREGTTGGTGLVIPWSKVVTTSGGVDADLGAGELVGARGAIELRDRCGCLTLRMMGSHRIGRDGVDVWLALDFAADR